ncbi:MAG: hypothetical protein NTU97_00560, partial [Candidatus Magasanikbacteria bacterium]|nr:hypothetical protein [Candidatus Magasanikbacteria bacterium]
LSFTDFLKKELKIDIRSLHPGNYLEAVDPIPLDRDLSVALGKKAVDLVEAEQFNLAVCVKRDDWTKTEVQVGTATLENMVGKGRYKFLEEDMFDFEKFQVKQKFLDYLAPVFPNYPDNQVKEYLALQEKITKKLM